MRRAKPEHRELLPDIRFNSVNIQIVIQHVLKSGKKSVATGLVYDAMDMIKERTEKDPMEVFDAALKNVGPVMEVRPRRVGGATYQVPMEVSSERQLSLAMRWLLAAARSRSGKSIAEKLANEFMDAAKMQGAAVKRRDDTHRMAEANRAFSHFRF